jgi:hypothetical protein
MVPAGAHQRKAMLETRDGKVAGPRVYTDLAPVFA